MLGPADIRAWLDDAEEARENERVESPPVSSDAPNARPVPISPFTHAFHDMMTWRRRLLGRRL